MRVAGRLLEPAVKALRVTRSEGTRVAVARGFRKTADRMSPAASPFPLFLEDVFTAAKPPRPMRWRSPGHCDPMVVNWVCTPPAPGSGGHTTMFRLIEHLENSGHICRLYFYDRWQNSVSTRGGIMRRAWPSIRAEVFDARDGIAPADAHFATSWESAHVLAKSPSLGLRFYLVQDFEPYFFPLGSERTLAEMTYKFGFHGICAGKWLAQRLTDDYDMPCEWFEFGCDTSVYSFREAHDRQGVVFYAKPEVPRRAFVLGALALSQLVQRCPEVSVHMYGAHVPELPFPVTSHGRLTTAELDALYNQCSVGLSLSMTNVSLVPWEMLASGCIPVVNDAPHNRMVLDNHHVVYAELEPHSLSDAMEGVLKDRDLLRRSRVGAASVKGSDWSEAGKCVLEILDREIRG